MRLNPSTRPAFLTGGRSLRNGWVVVVAILATLVSGASDLQAGCHSRLDRTSFQIDYTNSGITAGPPSIKLHGQLIYEGGQFRYVPWHDSPVCDGPNCRGEEQPEGASVPTIMLTRLILTDIVSANYPNATESRPDRLFSSDRQTPKAGYPHEHEYPP